MFKKITIIMLAAVTLAGCTGKSESKKTQNPSTNKIPITDTVPSGHSIRLTSPQPSQVLKSPFLVGGEAIVPGDIVYVRVKNPSGDVVISEQVRVKSEQGLTESPFGVLISFVFRSTDHGTVEVYGIDPVTGAEVETESVDVNFDTSSDGSAQTIQ
ncbi:hypothetical protein BK004_01035 [bacterium CG10_46_32]|nr:MAG: hypothetical protein BK004_01035 [bacterium CG10_46_32]PIR56474.1 MAG: hypothetical protein COU73_01045 [Parcubacteria group bacterium CG10_big_fil_rev_8_21_14_0_10_46_32]